LVDAALVLTLVGGGVPTASALSAVPLYRLISRVGVAGVGYWRRSHPSELALASQPANENSRMPVPEIRDGHSIQVREAPGRVSERCGPR
jgi:hypothetical protein